MNKSLEIVMRLGRFRGKRMMPRALVSHSFVFVNNGFVFGDVPLIVEMVHIAMTSGKCHWNPMDFLDIDNINISFAVLILNRPIRIQRKYMLYLWNKASVRVTVDGGTNRWHTFCESSNSDQNIVPDMITGDLDSIQQEVLSYYQSKGVEVIRTPDQNETDFTKALQQTAMYIQRKRIKLDAIISVVETSGRLDQIIGNINTLHKAGTIVQNIPVFLMGRNSLSWLLNCGSHEIVIPPDVISSRKWCSLLPIGCPATVTTTGLKWNLDNRILEFGKIVSTSNTFCGSPIVTVVSDRSIIWSMGLTISNEDDDDD